MTDLERTIQEHESEALGITESEQEDIDTVEAEARHITYSGQDFDVDGLTRRLKNKDILIPTFGHDDERIIAEGFQRAFVWRRPQMDKFIESLLLGYPIPGVFLVKQPDNRYLVLDGQQRLQTLKFFSEGLYAGREFALSNVADEFKGLTYRTLPDDLRRLFDNTFIQAIIVSSDGTTESLESIYNIFERLNSGGTQLTPHEIRVALYAGPFIDFLEELNNFDDWRNLYGNKSPRLRDQELILRIIGLYTADVAYKRPLKKFLNDVVAKHRSEGAKEHSNLRSLFERSATLVLNSQGRDGVRLGGAQVTASLAEVVMIGLMKRLDSKQKVPSNTAIIQAITALKENNTVREALVRATADEPQVATRLNKAVEIFSEA